MNDFDQIAMLLLIIVPLAGSLAMMFMPGNEAKETWYFAIFISGLSLILALIVFAGYDYDQGGFQYLVVTNGCPVHLISNSP